MKLRSKNYLTILTSYLLVIVILVTNIFVFMNSRSYASSDSLDKELFEINLEKTKNDNTYFLKIKNNSGLNISYVKGITKIPKEITHDSDEHIKAWHTSNIDIDKSAYLRDDNNKKIELKLKDFEFKKYSSAINENDQQIFQTFLTLNGKDYAIETELQAVSYLKSITSKSNKSNKFDDQVIAYIREKAFEDIKYNEDTNLKKVDKKISYIDNSRLDEKNNDIKTSINDDFEEEITNSKEQNEEPIDKSLNNNELNKVYIKEPRLDNSEIKNPIYSKIDSNQNNDDSSKKSNPIKIADNRDSQIIIEIPHNNDDKDTKVLDSDYDRDIEALDNSYNKSNKSDNKDFKLENDNDSENISDNSEDISDDLNQPVIKQSENSILAKTENRVVSGYAFDKNKHLLSNTILTLKKSNGKEIEVKTDENGFYSTRLTTAESKLVGDGFDIDLYNYPESEVYLKRNEGGSLLGKLDTNEYGYIHYAPSVKHIVDSETKYILSKDRNYLMIQEGLDIEYGDIISLPPNSLFPSGKALKIESAGEKHDEFEILKVRNASLSQLIDSVDMGTNGKLFNISDLEIVPQQGVYIEKTQPPVKPQIMTFSSNPNESGVEGSLSIYTSISKEDNYDPKKHVNIDLNIEDNDLEIKLLNGIEVSFSNDEYKIGLERERPKNNIKEKEKFDETVKEIFNTIKKVKKGNPLPREKISRDEESEIEGAIKITLSGNVGGGLTLAKKNEDIRKYVTLKSAIETWSERQSQERPNEEEFETSKFNIETKLNTAFEIAGKVSGDLLRVKRPLLKIPTPIPILHLDPYFEFGIGGETEWQSKLKNSQYIKLDYDSSRLIDKIKFNKKILAPFEKYLEITGECNGELLFNIEPIVGAKELAAGAINFYGGPSSKIKFNNEYKTDDLTKKGQINKYDDLLDYTLEGEVNLKVGVKPKLYLLNDDKLKSDNLEFEKKFLIDKFPKEKFNNARGDLIFSGKTDFNIFIKDKEKNGYDTSKDMVGHKHKKFDIYGEPNVDRKINYNFIEEDDKIYQNVDIKRLFQWIDSQENYNESTYSETTDDWAISYIWGNPWTYDYKTLNTVKVGKYPIQGKNMNTTIEINDNSFYINDNYYQNKDVPKLIGLYNVPAEFTILPDNKDGKLFSGNYNNFNQDNPEIYAVRYEKLEDNDTSIPNELHYSDAGKEDKILRVDKRIENIYYIDRLKFSKNTTEDYEEKSLDNNDVKILTPEEPNGNTEKDINTEINSIEEVENKTFLEKSENYKVDDLESDELKSEEILNNTDINENSSFIYEENNESELVQSL